jgi:pyridinium-3,5-bisthiocarboxylic acid mononucleotide nickel chelatase
VKVAKTDGRVRHASPEFEDCRKLAEDQNVPLQEVMEQALLQFQEQHKK